VTALALAFTAGLLATVNPCGFAMLPAFLSFYLGASDPDRVGGSRRRAGWAAGARPGVHANAAGRRRPGAVADARAHAVAAGQPAGDRVPHPPPVPARPGGGLCVPGRHGRAAGGKHRPWDRPDPRRPALPAPTRRPGGRGALAAGRAGVLRHPAGHGPWHQRRPAAAAPDPVAAGRHHHPAGHPPRRPVAPLPTMGDDRSTPPARPRDTSDVRMSPAQARLVGPSRPARALGHDASASQKPQTANAPSWPGRPSPAWWGIAEQQAPARPPPAAAARARWRRWWPAATGGRRG
jgi:hypothetical protein